MFIDNSHKTICEDLLVDRNTDKYSKPLGRLRFSPRNKNLALND